MSETTEMERRFDNPKRAMFDAYNLILPYLEGIAGAEETATEIVEKLYRKGKLNTHFVYAETYCSKCGNSFGAGPHGFSHCVHHTGLDGGSL